MTSHLPRIALSLCLWSQLGAVPVAPALATPSAPSAPSAPPATVEREQEGPADESAEQMGRWLRRYQRNGPETSLEAVQALDALVKGLIAIQRKHVDERPTVMTSLLDLAGVRTAQELRARKRDRHEADEVSGQTDRIRDLGRDGLLTILKSDPAGVARWLATEVLIREGLPKQRRLAAMRLLAGRYLPGTDLALFACALEEDAELRAGAMQALAGWPDNGVHKFMLKQRATLTERAELRARGRLRDPELWVPRNALRRHFGSVQLDPDSDEASELMDQATRAALGTDWREAFRAIGLMRCLPNDPAVPALIAALSTWLDRRTERDPGDKSSGGHSRRMEYELLRELERRSGRHLGAHPARWRTWWKAVGGQSDAEGSAGNGLPGSVTPPTRAAFFGLRPATDRMVFVIDRSGSMKTDFGDGDQSRYGQAIEQMLSFLRGLGPDARFSVLLFSSELEEWKPSLQAATENNLVAVERWLRYRRPKGGTFLEPAIERAMEIDSKGVVNLARLEADSIIVLCDGATAEGRSWIRPLLERVNDDACIAFHGVQVGTRGDGALELLAELTGGGFVEIPD